MKNTYKLNMSKICIARKTVVNNVELLDFAVDDSDNLMLFNTFREASEFLKGEVGEGEELLNFIITTTEAQKENPRLRQLMDNAKTVTMSSSSETKPVDSNTPIGSNDSSSFKKPNLENVSRTTDVECTFLLQCSDFEIINPEVIYNKILNKNLVPVIAFIDPENPQEIVQTPNLQLKATYLSTL